MHEQEVLVKPPASDVEKAALEAASSPSKDVPSSGSSSAGTAVGVPANVQEGLGRTEEPDFPPQTRTLSSRSTATMMDGDNPSKEKDEIAALEDLKNRPAKSQALWRCM